MTGTNTSDLSVLTYWEIQALPQRNLQLFVHVVSADDRVITQHDGFGAPPADWHVGDVVLQATRLNSSEDHVGPAWIEVGWYDQNSSQRLPVLVNGQAIGDRLLLGQVRH